MPSVDVSGVAVGALDRAGWVDHLVQCVERGTPHHHVSLNAAKWVAMRHDPQLRAAVSRATSVGADGIGIVLAARGVPERVAGADLAADLVAHAAVAGWRVALLGARPAVLATVADQLVDRGVHVVFATHGYHPHASAGAERALAQRISEARPHLLLVALGTPTAERFIDDHRDVLRVPLAVGVGGTFDVWAGVARRAPRVVQRVGLEWAWRLAGAPTARFDRAVLGSLRFVGAVARGQRVAP